MSINLKALFSSFYQQYTHQDVLQRDITNFCRLNTAFRLCQGAVTEAGRQVPVIALAGKLMYTYAGRQYPVNIIMYITYTYPDVQPKILVQPNPGT